MTSQESGNDAGPLVLAKYEETVGQIVELMPKEKARLTLALLILGSVLGLFILSGIALLYGPTDRLQEAQNVFDFIKSFGPPIVTLVIGFYFRNEGSP